MSMAEAELQTHAPAHHVTECAECERLTAGHDLARRDYGAAVEVLFATGYRFMDRTYAALKNAVETTRIHWEIARANLERHNRDCHEPD